MNPLDDRSLQSRFSALGASIDNARRAAALSTALVGAALAVAGLVPAGASAATVASDGSTLSLTAKAGETNVVSVFESGGAYVVRDSGATITDGDGPAGASWSPPGPVPGDREGRRCAPATATTR